LSGAIAPPVPIDQPMSRSIELTPLSHSPLLSADPRTLSKAISEPTRQPIRPPILDEFGNLLNTPAKLRELIVLNEILQPPLSLRRRGPLR